MCIIGKCEMLMAVTFRKPGTFDAEGTVLKKCIWKGVVYPCSSIFKPSPTDHGMCCTFNMPDASDIFVDSQFSRVMSELQDGQTKTSDNVKTHFYYTAVASERLEHYNAARKWPKLKSDLELFTFPGVPNLIRTTLLNRTQNQIPDLCCWSSLFIEFS